MSVNQFDMDDMMLLFLDKYNNLIEKKLKYTG